MAVHKKDKDKDRRRQELKRIKELTSSVLTAMPSLGDNTSELITNIGVAGNVSSHNKR